MQEVKITELRNHLPKYLERAHKGSEILVTSHGQVIARILPPENTKKQAQQQLMSLRKKCKVIDAVSPIDDEWDAEK